jgi:hypothetical protein
MTLIELIVFIVMLALGGVVARLLYPIGGLWTAIPGFVAGLVLIPGIGLVVELYTRWVYRGDYLFPPCVCGKADFIADGLNTRCQTCGRVYDKRKDGVYVIEGEEKRPYMKLVKHQGWIKMNSQQQNGAYKN